jgi:hypothetical protein
LQRTKFGLNPARSISSSAASECSGKCGKAAVPNEKTIDGKTVLIDGPRMGNNAKNGLGKNLPTSFFNHNADNTCQPRSPLQANVTERKVDSRKEPNIEHYPLNA